MIINQAEGLKRLVNEFSSYARMPTSNPVPDDINKIIREAAGLYQETKNNVEVRFNESEGIPILNVDREQMKRVIINLLDNAIAAVDDDGLVEINLSFDEDLEVVKIEVADNGKGIPPDHKMRLFEPYFSTKKQGTGLGLAIVNSIVSDHNGLIEVHDNIPNGTRFTIELPLNT
jgi:two-component system nitrogen regulation sensor histidine kinase NtrY